MEELIAGLQNSLSSPQGQERLAGLQGLLGGNQTESPAPDLSSLLGLLSGSGEGNPKPDNTPTLPPAGDPLPFDPSLLLKLGLILQQSRADDKNTRLLQALRPFFSEGRQTRIDQALRMLRLLSMLPALQESGLLSSLQNLF